MEVNDCSSADYFSSRRTVRRYLDRPIDESVLNSIIERAMRAPTTGNMQLYTVIVTRSQEGKKLLSEAHFNQPQVMSAPVVLTICADFNRFTRWCELSGADPGFDNFLSFLSATLDATILAQQIVTIAESEGLGTCYLGTATFNAARISEILDLPQLVVPIACLSIGYPADEGTPTERLPLRASVHDEKYRRDSDQEILSFFKAKDDYPLNEQYIKENNKDTLAQVFTDVRYPRSMNEGLTVEFLDFLKKQNFLK